MPCLAMQFSARNIGHQTPRLINGPTGAGSELVGAHESGSERLAAAPPMRSSRCKPSVWCPPPKPNPAHIL